MKLCIVTFLGALLVATTAGCAAEGPEPSEADGETTSQDMVGSPDGVNIASVTANGMGCATGTWEAALGPDGTSVAVRFHRYSASVEPGQAMAIADCTVAIDLVAPQGYEYAVNSVAYEGYANLDSPGMKATQTAKYYFMGNSLPAKELRTDMVGPYDDSYVFDQPVASRDLVWSRCGVQRRIEAQSRLIVQNNEDRSGAGGALVDAEVVFRYGLSWRHC